MIHCVIIYVLVKMSANVISMLPPKTEKQPVELVVPAKLMTSVHVWKVLTQLPKPPFVLREATVKMIHLVVAIINFLEMEPVLLTVHTILIVNVAKK